MKQIKEWKGADRETLESQIVPSKEPAVIRSLVRDWYCVSDCPDSRDRCAYIESLDADVPVYTIAAPPDAGGRFFYNDDLKGLNFKSGQIPLPQILGQLLAQIDDSDAHSIAVQSLPVREVLPNFEKQNPMPLLDPEIAPTMWIGNRGKVAPHYDVHRNIACVVDGSRRFTVFPPDQVANLYPGPILGAPGGVPISLVDTWDPDYDKFPRYADALAAAQEALLEPGDAIYIPSLWWHAVESLESINVLVNYWWGGIADSGISPNDSLLHAMLTIVTLDEEQRKAWRDFFEYYVFQAGQDPKAHLPEGLEDIVTSLSPEQVLNVRRILADKLLENP